MLVSIIFAVVLVVAFLVEVVLTETEQFGWSTVLLLATGAICYYFNVYGLALWVKAHVLQTVIFVGVYLVVGLIWSFIKWTSFLLKYRDQWREAKEHDKNGLPKLIEKAKEEIILYNETNPNRPTKGMPAAPHDWERYLISDWSYSKHLRARSFSKPLASEHKSKIIAWMCFWPFSFLGTLVNDPIRLFFNFLFSQFKALYQHLSDYLFKNEETQ